MNKCTSLILNWALKLQSKDSVRFGLLSILVTTLFACANTNALVSAKVIHQSPQCGISEAGIEKIERKTKLSQIVNHGIRPANKPIPDANFEAQHIVSVSMGMKPSSGYSISLKNDKAKVENQTAYLDIESKKPGKDSMNAMVMTSPCIVLTIEKGPYSKIEANSHSLELP